MMKKKSTNDCEFDTDCSELRRKLENFNMSTARLRVLFMCSYSIDASYFHKSRLLLRRKSAGY